MLASTQKKKEKKVFILGGSFVISWKTKDLRRCTIPTYNNRRSEGAKENTLISPLSKRKFHCTAQLFCCISFLCNFLPILYLFYIFNFPFISIHLYLQNPWCTLNPLLKEKMSRLLQGKFITPSHSSGPSFIS